MILRATLSLALAATAAWAEPDASPDGQLIEGYLACALGGGDWNVTVPMLSLYGWTSTEDAETEVVSFEPGTGNATFAYMSQTPGYCHVESTVLGTGKAAEVLDLAVSGSGQIMVEGRETSPDGCETFVLSNGVVAVITSGGNDPVCTSDANSGVRFYFGEG